MPFVLAPDWPAMCIVCFIIVTNTMSTFIHCSMVGVVTMYPQNSMIMQPAFVSCVLYHYDGKVILYDDCLDCRGLCIK